MKGLFKARVSKFGSLISIVALSAMLVLFALALPEFFSSAAGRFFAGIWAALAIAVFWAHTARLSEERRRPSLAQFFATNKQDSRGRKEHRGNRILRG